MKIVNESYDGENFVELHINERELNRFIKDGVLKIQDKFGSEFISFAIILEYDKQAPLDPEVINEKKTRNKRFI